MKQLTGLLVSVEDLAHTSVRDPQFATDLTWPHAVAGQLDDLMTNGDWQRSAVDEDAPQLIHTSLKI